MEKQEADQLQEGLNAINATLKQIKDDLASVKAEVHTIHGRINDLPTGVKWVSET